MSMQLAQLDTLISPIAASMQLRYWGAMVVNDGGATILRILIDKPGGVSIDDCTALGRSLNAVFDVEEPLRHKYTLEVSSPGIDRPLLQPWHYSECVGKEILLVSYEAIDGVRKFKGILQHVSDSEVVLVCNEVEYKILFNQIRRANLNS